MVHNHNRISLSDVLPNTWIHHDTDQEKRFVETSLRQIREKFNGRSLFSELFKSLGPEREIRIKITLDDVTQSKPYVHKNVLERMRVRNVPDSKIYQKLLDQQSCYSDASYLMYSKKKTPGVGTSTEILYNPNESRITDEYGISERRLQHHFAFVSLAHELVHAMYNAKGERFKEDPSKPFEDPNEDRAIGLDNYKHDSMTENGIRHDYNLYPRSSRYDWNEIKPLSEKYLKEV